MSFICKNGPEHRHETSEQSRACWGVAGSTAPPAPATPVLPPSAPYSHEDAATAAQLRYVEILGGDAATARSLSKRACSEYINRLKGDKRRAKVTAAVTPPLPEPPRSTPAPAPAPVQPKTDPKVEMLIKLLATVPDGRFAVRPDSTVPYTFIRISHPKHGKWTGTQKVQTQHGPNLSEEKLVVRANGTYFLRYGCYDLIDNLMLVVADFRGAARAYARELARCCRCATSLTDDRSKHYGIGPECETHWTWMIEQVDSENDGLSYETLLRLGRVRSTA